MVFDLPAVAERARSRLAEQGLADRVTVQAAATSCANRCRAAPTW